LPNAVSPANVGRLAALGRAFKHRNYRLFFAGQLVSLIGTWTQSVAQIWLVYRLTGSALLLGTVTFCQQVPVFLLATVGGMVADRVPRRSVLVVTQSAAMTLAFILSGLTLGGVVKVGHILVLATMLGIVNAFDIPTRQSFVSQMVGRENLMNAVALNSSMVNGARIIGPAIAGFSVKAFGEGWCFFINGLSFIAVISGLLAMRDLPEAPPRDESESAMSRIVEGFRFVVTEKRVRALLILFAVTALAGMPYSTLMPIFASKVFHGDARTLGLLMGAIGVGALGGALALASRARMRGTDTWVNIACGTFGASLVLFALSKTFWLSMIILVPLGASMMTQLSATNTRVQTMTPDALRGRVMAVWAMIFMGFAPFGSLLAGWLAGSIGPARTLMAGGTICMVGACAFALWLPRLRAESRTARQASRAGMGDGPS
jgi:MFS family permease